MKCRAKWCQEPSYHIIILELQSWKVSLTPAPWGYDNIYREGPICLHLATFNTSKLIEFQRLSRGRVWLVAGWETTRKWQVEERKNSLKPWKSIAAPLPIQWSATLEHSCLYFSTSLKGSLETTWVLLVNIPASVSTVSITKWYDSYALLSILFSSKFKLIDHKEVIHSSWPLMYGEYRLWHSAFLVYAYFSSNREVGGLNLVSMTHMSFCYHFPASDHLPSILFCNTFAFHDPILRKECLFLLDQSAKLPLIRLVISLVNI